MGIWFVTFWQSNMAMESLPFTVGFPTKTSFYRGCSWILTYVPMSFQFKPPFIGDFSAYHVWWHQRVSRCWYFYVTEDVASTWDDLSSPRPATSAYITLLVYIHIYIFTITIYIYYCYYILIIMYLHAILRTYMKLYVTTCTEICNSTHVIYSVYTQCLSTLASVMSSERSRRFFAKRESSNLQGAKREVQENYDVWITQCIIIYHHHHHVYSEKYVPSMIHDICPSELYLLVWEVPAVLLVTLLWG